MNDKEIIKKLAEGIKDTYISHHSECCIHCNIYDDDGTFIRDNFGFYHNLNCPVLLAEEVLKEVPKDKGMLKYLKPIVDGLRKEGAIFVPPVNTHKTPFRDALDELQADIAKQGPSKERFCPSCGGQETIGSVKGTEPYSEDYLMCNKCDSTFNKEDKKPMKLYKLQHYVDKLIEQGYSDTLVYFDTEAKTYDRHIVPIGSINLVPKEAMGEDYIVISEYKELPEEPIIVHNIMSYRGKNYLRQKAETMRCSQCAVDGMLPDDKLCESYFGCKINYCYWKSFDDIQITDELACMRKDIGDIYLYNIQENKIDKLIYVENDRDMYIHTIGWRSTNNNMRLATAEEIQKHLEDK